ANVVRIERPGNPEDFAARHEADFQNKHRNKRGMALNLRSDEGRAILYRMIEKTDVLVENFRPDVKTRLKFDYETLRSKNPRLIYASISAFGQDGPYGDRPGVDQVVQGMSGLMSVTGEPGHGPMRVGVAISDTSAGMFLGQGILLALLSREQTGRGQWVHTSLLEAMLNKLDFQGARYTMSGEVPGQEGNNHPMQVPMGTFESSDGLVNVAASSGKMWEAFCATLGAEELLHRPEYRGVRARQEHKIELRADVQDVTRRFTTAELVEKLNAVGVPCGPINTIGEAFEDPQVKHLRMTRTAHHPVLGDLQLIRSPINLSEFEQPPAFHHAAPDPGQDTDEVLRDFGFDAAHIAQLHASGAIA